MESLKIKWISWLKALLYAGAIFLIYRSALKYLVFYEWAREDYSHCALIPLVVLYLLWEKRRDITGVASVPSWLGFVPFVVGILLFWLGELGGEYFTLYISLWFVIVGISSIHLGWRKIRILWFPLVLMLAMFPFPNFINSRITLQLKLISSKLGVFMLHLYGLSAYREGNYIDLGFIQLQVADACSGLRYVFPLLILSMLLAHWLKGHWWKKIILFLSAVPLAILINSIRIAATGILYTLIGSEVAEGFFHGFSGWLIFIFAAVFFVLEMWVLRKMPPAGKIAVETVKSDEIRETKQNIVPVSGPQKSWAPILTCLAVFLLSFLLMQGIEFHRKVPINRPLENFPLVIGEWRGVRDAMEQGFVNVLKFSDYTIVNYKDNNAETINFYVAYYDNQQKGEAIHSPESCLPGTGWDFRNTGSAEIPGGPGRPSMLINRAIMEKEGSRHLVYFWFPQRGRILTNIFQLKAYAFLDSLTRRRTDGALVRIITAVGKNENLSDTELRLKHFSAKIAPILDEFIPQ